MQDRRAQAARSKTFDRSVVRPSVKSLGNKTVRPDELARTVLRLAMEGERKNYADRLRREFHSLNELSLEIRHAAAAPYGSCSLQSYSLQLNTRYRSSSASTHSMSA